MSMTVSDAVISRRSVRAFLDKPVPLETLQRVLDKARFAPSGCNFQPWEATVLTGEPLRALQEKLLHAQPQDPVEYVINPPGLGAPWTNRLHELGSAMYSALGVDRGDKAARDEVSRKNIVSFGAPAVLLCYTHRIMGSPQWSDIGMWLQTVMLLLRDEGLDSCAQEWLAYHGRLIKDHIGVSDETHIFFCGIAIGWRDEDAPVNRFERPRVPLDQQVRFLGF